MWLSGKCLASWSMWSGIGADGDGVSGAHRVLIREHSAVSGSGWACSPTSSEDLSGENPSLSVATRLTLQPTELQPHRARQRFPDSHRSRRQSRKCEKRFRGSASGARSEGRSDKPGPDHWSGRLHQPVH